MLISGYLLRAIGNAAPFTFFWYVLSISGYARLVKPFIKIDTHRPCVSEWRLFGNAASTAWAAAFLLNADMIGAAAGPFEVTGNRRRHSAHRSQRWPAHYRLRHCRPLRCSDSFGRQHPARRHGVPSRTPGSTRRLCCWQQSCWEQFRNDIFLHLHRLGYPVHAKVYQ